MARYIDADKFLKSTIAKFKCVPLVGVSKYIYGEECFEGEHLDTLINETPTEDVEEVRHGEWIDRYGNKYLNHLYDCSVCGKEALYECYKNDLDQWTERQALTPICPNCGARMDGTPKERGGEK